MPEMARSAILTGDEPPETREVRRESLLPQSDKTVHDFLQLRTKADLHDWSEAEFAGALRITETTIDNYIALQEALEDSERRLTAVEQERDRQSLIIDGLTARQLSRAATPDLPTKLSMKIPDPPTFTGEGKYDVDDWLAKMHTKLTANTDHFTTESLKKAYVQSRIEGAASQSLASRFRRNTTNPFRTANDILDELERLYSDPNRADTARREFRKLYQNDRDFNSFWVEFQKLASETDYTDDTLKSELRNKVSRELADAIVTEINTSTVYELARRCQLYDQNIQANKARRARPTTRPVVTSVPTPTTAASTSPNPASRTTTTRTAVPTNRPVISAERLAEYKAGVCFYCKKPGHKAVECPSRRDVAQNRTVNSIEENVAEKEDL
jgi:hypothetical protein